MCPGEGGEIAVGILGVEPRLDGVPALEGPFAGQLAAGGDVQLCPDQVVAVGHLGDGVLHLQSGVDLQEGEQLLSRVVEELDGGGPAVAHGYGEPLGGGLDFGDLLRA